MGHITLEQRYVIALMLKASKQVSEIAVAIAKHKSSARWVARVSIEALKNVKCQIKTITSDNGKEFSNHEQISKSLEID